MKHDISGHIIGFSLTAALLCCFGATMFHHYTVNRNEIVQQITKEAMEWKAMQTSN